MIQQWKAMGLVLFGAASFGFMSILLKLAYEKGYRFADVIGMQMLAGFVLLLIGTTILGKWEKINGKQFLQLLLAGCLNGITSICFQTSLSHVTASLAIVLLFQFTWIGVLIESVLEKKRPSKEKIMAIGLLLAGTVMASNLMAEGISGLSLIGVVAGLMSAVMYSVTLATNSKLAVSVNPWMRSMVISIGSMLLIWAVFRPTPFTDGAVSGGLWYWAMMIACFAILIPNVCFAAGIPKIGSGLAGILGSVELPATLFFSWMILNETITPVQWLGNLVIVLGIVTTRLKLGKRNKHVQSMNMSSQA